MIYIIISIILLVIFSIILLSIYKKKKKYLEKEYKQEYYIIQQEEFAKIHEELQCEFEARRQQAQEQYQEYLRNKEQERSRIEQSLIERKQAVEEIIAEAEKRKQEIERYYQDLTNNGKEQVEIRVKAHEDQLMSNAKARIAEEASKRRNQMEQELAAFFAQCTEKQTQAQIELDKVRDELADFQKKQQVVNEEILRRRQVEEQQDFYRIILSEQDKEDIHYLISIINNIKNKQLLYKLIWSEYLQKPFNEMLKRVLEEKEIRCVIYKITNLKTGEIYIGKTKAEASKRWTEHIKTSLNIGTIARSKIHTMLFEHWDEFSFEILEKVSDETLLSSREKFYINFYQSNIYGYNMNSGG